MLILPVLGFLAGVVLGDVTSIPRFVFYSMRAIVVGLIPLLMWLYFCKKRRRVSSVIATCSALIWGLVHNPSRDVSPYSTGKVISSSGCGIRNDEILVDVDNWIYQAQGPVLVGELVEFNGAQTLRSGRTGELFFQKRSPFLWCRVGFLIHSHFNYRIRQFPPDIASWLRAFVLGEQTKIPPEVLESFRALGLLHLLVLSGGHLSVVAALLNISLRLPWHIGYVLGRLSAVSWVKVTSISQVMTVLLVFVYCAAAGFSQSLQRALLCFVSQVLPPMLGVSQSAQGRILLAVVLQALFFPVNFLSVSLLMSWCGVLLLTCFLESSFLKSYFRVLIDAVLLQAVFFVFSLIFFGRVGLLAIPANMIFQFVFSVLLPLDIVVLTLPLYSIDRALAELNRMTLGWIKFFSDLQSHLTLPEIAIADSLTVNHLVGRALVAVLMIGLFVLIRWRQTDL